MTEYPIKETKVIQQITFVVKASGQGGAGWIGKVDVRDTPAGHPGHMGVYFGHPQEYSTFEPHMINALRKSGVAIELYAEDVEVNIETDEHGYKKYEHGTPPAEQVTNEHGETVNLDAMDLPDLKIMAKEMALVLKPGQNAKHLVSMIRMARAKDLEK